MSLIEYVSQITATISEFTETGLITFSDLATDFRTEKIGLIKSEIAFIDGSKLFFKEYIDLRYGVDKEAYSYHYQNQDCTMKFRYDNASHKPALDFSEHKHSGDKIAPS